MDNGQHHHLEPVANTPEQGNSFEPISSATAQHNRLEPVSADFNDKEWQRSLEISAPVGIPSPDKITQETKSASPLETPAPSLEPSFETTPSSNRPESPSAPSALGQITSLGAPNQSNQVYRPSYNPVNVRTTGDHLEKSSIKEVDNAIDELNRTGNLSAFYDEIRGEDSMLDANLGNSFSRKIGENNLGGGA